MRLKNAAKTSDEKEGMETQIHQLKKDLERQIKDNID